VRPITHLDASEFTDNGLEKITRIVNGQQKSISHEERCSR